MDLNTREGRRAQGQLIQAAAKAAGYSAEQIADIAECSRALVYQYYSGATLVQTDRLQRIADALGKPMAFFFGESGAVAPEQEPPPFPAMLATDWARDSLPSRKQTARTMAREDIPPPHVDAALSDLSELAQAQVAGPDPDGLLRTAERIIALARLSGRLREEADAHFRAGNARLQRREASLGIPHLRRAREIYERLEDEAMYRQVTQSIGSALAALGDFEEARIEFEGVASATDWSVRWRGQVGLASLYEQAGELDLALQALAHVLVAYEGAPDPKESADAVCYARANQVNVYLALGELEQAVVAAMECEREADVLVLPDQRVESLYNMGLALTALGRTAQAIERLDLARQLASFAGDEGRALIAQSAHAWSEALIGWNVEAVARAQAALRTSNRGTDDRAHGVCERELARILERLGRNDEALYHADEAARVLSDLRMEVPFLESRVLAARLTAAIDGTCKPLLAVRDRAATVGARVVEMEARIGLAQWGAASDRADEARQALTLARAMKHVDGVIRAAGILSLHVSDPEEESDLLGEAIGCMEQLRCNAPSGKECVLEDATRLSLCRRYLHHLREGRGPDPEEWLDKMAWPPIADAAAAEE